MCVAIISINWQKEIFLINKIFSRQEIHFVSSLMTFKRSKITTRLFLIVFTITQTSWVSQKDQLINIRWMMMNDLVVFFYCTKRLQACAKLCTPGLLFPDLLCDLQSEDGVSFTLSLDSLRLTLTLQMEGCTQN